MENYLLKISPQSDLAPRTKPAEQTHPGFWEPVLSGGIIVAFVLHTARKNSFSELE